MFGSALAVTLLVSPHEFTHDLTLMLLAVLLVIGSSQWELESGWRLALISSIVILYTIPLYFMLTLHHELCLLALVLGLFAVSTLGLADAASRQELPIDSISG
jgi:hypothetical protein